MEETFANSGRKIPIYDGSRTETDRIVFYPDELPEDQGLLSDILRGVFAPFRVWRNCAVEYHRQGMDSQFEQLLTEIVAALEDPDIDKLYQQQDKEDYAEGIIDIYIALAAKALSNYANAKQAPNVLPQVVMDFNKKIVDNLKIVDEKQRLNQYAWLIRGFYEILQGDLKRAEDHFRFVHDGAAKGVAGKKKYYFGSLVGMGVVAYAAQKHEQALGYFVKAVQTNPEASGASVRTAVALCCFKLEQFDRARQALEKSLAVDPADPRALLLMAMVEQATAKRDRTKRAQCHAQAFEYCCMANAVEPGNPQTLNMLANHHFHSWRSVQFSAGGCCIVDAANLIMPAAAAQDLVVARNLLRLQSGKTSMVFTIVSVTPLEQERAGDASGAIDDYVTVEVVPRILSAFLSADGGSSTCASVEVKDLAAVERLAHQAVLRASLPASKAESNYILGKVAHSLRDSNLAFDFYWKALKDAPDMTLAAFGAAEILYMRREFQASLELFEKVLLQSPEDKDTQAYVVLLKANLRGEVAPFEKLREIAPEFQHEADLWLVQGQLRQHDPAQHKHALKCFLNAKDCLELNGKARAGGGATVPSAVLSNIAVLHHSLGSLSKALEFGRLALLAVPAERGARGDNDTDNTGMFRSAELEGVFYSWSSHAACELNPGTDRGCFTLANPPSLNLMQLVAVGDEVLIAGVKCTVKEVRSATEIVCASPVLIAQRDGSALDMRVKQTLHNFVDESLTYSFNYARLLEDDGLTKAATEIYVALLKLHPSYMECYLRLSMICSDLGKFDEAAVWLSRALAVNEDEAEATLCLGDLYSRSGNLEEAKKCYDKVCNANRHDSKAMLSLGNFYFAYHGGAKADSQLKESYKFFFHVLNENHSNAFAANGLGMVSAKKSELDVARETFAKARESNVTMTEDICTNLAHVYLMQQRGADAERLYQATMKSLSRSGRCTSDKPAYLSECVASIQLKSRRFEEAARSVLKALHTNPTNLRCWYNLAFVGQTRATFVLGQPSGLTGDLVDEARAALLLSKTLFKHLGTIQHSASNRPYERKFASTNYLSCSTNLPAVEKLLRAMRVKESTADQEKRRRDADHSALIKSKSEQKELEVQALESERLAKQQLAEQKERKLQELREKWTASVVEKAQPKIKGAQKEGGVEVGANKKRSRGQKARSGDGSGADGGVDGEDDEVNDALMRALSSKGDIDFGSSGDEDEGAGEVASQRELRPRAAKPSANVDDLFGDSDEDSTSAAIPSSGLPARKRLKKAGVEGARGNDDDDDILADEEVEGNVMQARKQHRIVADDSD